MRTIFSSILGGFLAAYEFSAEQTALALPLVDATIESYGAIREAMPPTNPDPNPHPHPHPHPHPRP
jgi:hypothetical protein